MGYKLYREVLDLMPWDWTPGERLVALVLADDAGEKTRISYMAQAVLCQRTGYTPDGLKRVFQRLAHRGFEFRVPRCIGRDGRAVYSARGGYRVDYEIPDLVEALKTTPPKPVDKSRKAGQQSLLPEPEGGTPVPEGGTPVPEGGTPVPDGRDAGTAPFPQSPQHPLNISSLNALAAVNGYVEGSPPMRGQDRSMSVIEAQAWAAVSQRAASA